MDDIDVPLPRPLPHTIAVIDPSLDGVAAGALHPGTVECGSSQRFSIVAAMRARAQYPAMARTATDFRRSQWMHPFPTG
ncbi:MAG TPA: hypothetical protein VEF72_25880 [Mycobacterium sp.]|nr:hypothetical protein [Mycobacterium sp.]